MPARNYAISSREAAAAEWTSYGTADQTAAIARPRRSQDIETTPRARGSRRASPDPRDSASRVSAETRSSSQRPKPRPDFSASSLTSGSLVCPSCLPSRSRSPSGVGRTADLHVSPGLERAGEDILNRVEQVATCSPRRSRCGASGASGCCARCSCIAGSSACSDELLHGARSGIGTSRTLIGGSLSCSRK
jgi:hypothetical protein